MDIDGEGLLLERVLEWMIIGLVGSIIVSAWLLIPPILRPTVIAYPWRMPESYSYRERDKTRTVVLAGSFNPPHFGHLAMLEYLSKRYKQVIVVIGINPNKIYAVTPAQRVELLRKMLQVKKLDKNIRVEVYAGYIWRYARQQGATIFFRGIRSWERDGKEERSLQILNTWGPLVCGPFVWPLPTIFLEGKPEYNHISSTLIRDLTKDMAGTESEHVEQSLQDLVPPEVAKELSELYSKEAKKAS
ncbi:Phosphopantetheine adenylyltransferase [Seminavis robusta]|uniref:Phosphopantetheine adenylyltransferase n=1 Tax=Seminavis robusta TaxID=568900 RepID=A0A9N8H5I7_9STRA|nr:Phosphopantetheine adenylyltransferase [Seminavis robusta]|eukprot:Sro115_g056790.1 Phosphopantetheine adenylyltransferase (245) ;mRNA; f:60601-61514